MEGDGGLHSVVVLTEWISIHALRVEGDRHPLTRFRDRWHFYPRPPGGGRPRGNFHGLYIEIFLSTPSGWRATRAFHTVTRRSDYFYPRPPGGGRRHDDALFPEHKFAFLSTPSGWRATCRGDRSGDRRSISIHALRVEGDFIDCVAWRTTAISIHALRVEGDYRGRESSRALPISIHALRVEGDLAAAVAFVAM